MFGVLRCNFGPEEHQPGLRQHDDLRNGDVGCERGRVQVRYDTSMLIYDGPDQHGARSLDRKPIKVGRRWDIVLVNALPNRDVFAVTVSR